MACTNPRRAWRRPEALQGPLPPRVDTDTGELLAGRSSLSFHPVDGWDPLKVGCGVCVGCRADRSREWAIRCYHEASQHDRNCFVTLTYENAPPALVKKDLQDFFKRLRHQVKFRYLACGEYGDKTRRPHYHALIFGEDFLGGALKIGESLYTNPALAKAWGHGLVSVGELNMATCCYVAGYVFKKVGDHDTFSLASRRPGIGHNWLDKFGDDIRRTGVVTIEGKEYPVPRRYMDWHSEELHDLKIERREIFASQSYDEVMRKEKQLRAKALNHKSRRAARSGAL